MRRRTGQPKYVAPSSNGAVDQNTSISAPPSVFVVDDDPFALEIIANLLRSADYEVTTFDSPVAFLDSDAFERADCAVLDLSMPELSGLDLQNAIASRGDILPVVFLTGNADVKRSVQAMKRGAIDFLLKPADRDELLTAVARALEEGARARAKKAEQDDIEARFSRLTPREREVCYRLAQGSLNKQIAFDLDLSEATVKIHRARIMEKLQVSSIAELSALIERSNRGRERRLQE